MPNEPEISPSHADPEIKSGWASFGKSLIRWLIAITVLVALSFAVKHSVDHWRSQAESSRLRLSDLDPRWLMASAILYAAGLFPAAIVLSRALRSLGLSLPLRAVASAQIIGHLGKYVPGKAMVVIVRASILNRDGIEAGSPQVSLRAATIAIMLETLTLIATGASLALLVVAFLEVPSWIRGAGGVVALGAIFATWPPLLRLAISRRIVGGSLKFDWTSQDMLVAWFWNASSWALLGGSLMAVVLSLPESIREPSYGSPAILYLICFASLALAFVAGFLSFLPGGALAREVVLTTMLAPVTGPSGALITAILLRMIHLTVEIVLAGMAWFFLPQKGSGITTDMDARHVGN